MSIDSIMGEKCVTLRKLRDFRDLIFDAKFNGVWVRFSSLIIRLFLDRPSVGRCIFLHLILNRKKMTLFQLYRPCEEVVFQWMRLVSADRKSVV